MLGFLFAYCDIVSGIWDTGNMLYMYLVSVQMLYNMLFHLHILKIDDPVSLKSF